MDCGSCALKIENALHRLPGVGDVEVSYSQEKLTFTLEEDRTSVAAVEGKIRSLGFTPISDHRSAADKHSNRPVHIWWHSRKARFIAVVAVLSLMAFISGRVFPAYRAYGWSLVAVLALIPIVRRSYAGATSGTPFSIETLMSIAAIGALVIGAAQEAVTVIFLFAVGEMLEGIAASKARAGIAGLVSFIPREALIDRDGVLERVSADALTIGNIVIVRPGDRIPADGRVADGSADVDESPITGESIPVYKLQGATVYAGSVSTNGELRIEVTSSASDNTISRIVRLVEQAQGSKAPMARFIDQFSRRYTPVAMVVALLISIVPPLAFGGLRETWIYRGLATLLIACPCALVISTPAAIASGLAALARRGLLVKGGAALETLARVKTIAFDKTGTLTEGRPQVTDVVAFNGTQDNLLARAAAVEQKANHPLGGAIIAAASARNLPLPTSYGTALTITGKAITARLQGGFVTVGSPRYAAEQVTLNDATRLSLEALESQGKTAVVILSGKQVDGIIALRDEPRADARQAITQLHGLGLRTVMLTGDNQRAGVAVGQMLGVDVAAELLPEGKLTHIASLREHGPVAMIGDGVNDAPALAAASVGVAMGAGTDVALETADAALLHNRLVGVVEMITLAKATLGNIRQNIALALGLKAIFLLMTLFGVTTLWMAILADTGATILVTANALRLLKWQHLRDA
jgi:Cd2+/Zn2+-exporting ATPase